MRLNVARFSLGSLHCFDCFHVCSYSVHIRYQKEAKLVPGKHMMTPSPNVLGGTSPLCKITYCRSNALEINTNMSLN